MKVVVKQDRKTLLLTKKGRLAQYMKRLFVIILLLSSFLNASELLCLQLYQKSFFHPLNKPQANSLQSLATFKGLLGSESLERLTYYTIRSSYQGHELQENWKTKNIFSAMNLNIESLAPTVEKKKAFGQLDMALKKLYESYANQGEERSSNIFQYMNEDKATSKRTTHFLISANEEVIAHIQAQHSFTKEEPLNVETHFSEASQFIRKNPGNMFIELGRFEILRAAKVTNLINKKMLSNRQERQKIFSDIWIKLTSWLLEQPQLNEVVFQVNEAMYEVLKSAFYPLSLNDKIRVQQDANSAKEWLIKLSKSDIISLQKLMFENKMKILLVDFLKSAGSEFTMSVEANEQSLHSDLGTYNLSAQYYQQSLRQYFEKNLPRGMNLTIKTSYDSSYSANPHLVRFGQLEARQLLQILNSSHH